MRSWTSRARPSTRSQDRREGKLNAQRLEPEVEEVVHQHGDQRRDQRRLDRIAAPRAAPLARHEQRRDRDRQESQPAHLDEILQGLVLDEREANRDRRLDGRGRRERRARMRPGQYRRDARRGRCRLSLQSLKPRLLADVRRGDPGQDLIGAEADRGRPAGSASR